MELRAIFVDSVRLLLRSPWVLCPGNEDRTSHGSSFAELKRNPREHFKRFSLGVDRETVEQLVQARCAKLRHAGGRWLGKGLNEVTDPLHDVLGAHSARIDVARNRNRVLAPLCHRFAGNADAIHAPSRQMEVHNWSCRGKDGLSESYDLGEVQLCVHCRECPSLAKRLNMASPLDDVVFFRGPPSHSLGNCNWVRIAAKFESGIESLLCTLHHSGSTSETGIEIGSSNHCLESIRPCFRWDIIVRLDDTRKTHIICYGCKRLVCQLHGMFGPAKVTTCCTEGAGAKDDFHHGIAEKL
mmetsp:Transcript_20703/g.58942  ORF Transcript_20703/g.58942 Transcript_20703/m.58942 type:complete len:298 (+) Transcript_20703:1799-2692(+)